MFRWTVLSGVLLVSASTLSVAQTPPRPTDPVFVRAQALVSDGNGAAGRALIDSVIKATPLTAPLYPQALFWRATLAANAADAESDYKHIVVDYPLAPQAADALLRLAQLELARGDREGALGHLQRIPRDYPRSKLLARASYWTARVLFEKNDVPNACVANANALAQADLTEIELRNQIQYQRQRCPSTIVVATAQREEGRGKREEGGVAVVPSEKAKLAVDTVIRVTAAGRAGSEVTAQPPPPQPPPLAANDSRPGIIDRTKPAAARGYSVQVAAFTHQSEAEKLVSTLTKSGYQARVDGSVAPFRVRIGRYTTEREAEDALRRIEAKRMEGFVVRAPER